MAAEPQQQPVERQELSPASLTYEQTRDELKGVAPLVRDTWQKADRSAANLLELYQSLQKDSDLTPEARSRKADEFYSRESPKIEQSWQQTREELRGAAEALARMSTPRPKGEKLEATTSEELLTAQNEAARIIRVAERRANAKGPLRQRPTGVLKEEYQKGRRRPAWQAPPAVAGSWRPVRSLAWLPKSGLRICAMTTSANL